jgi:hypothetical protein
MICLFRNTCNDGCRGGGRARGRRAGSRIAPFPEASRADGLARDAAASNPYDPDMLHEVTLPAGLAVRRTAR